MKNRIKFRREHRIGGRAGVKHKRHRWSWWCYDATFSPCSVTPKPRAEQPCRAPDGIVIPEEFREKELAGVPMSARLRHVLDDSGCRLLGDLHGLRFSELRERRGCGQRTIQELKTLVKHLQREALLESISASQQI